MATHEGMIVKATNVVAAAGLITPAWFPYLLDVSEMAAALVPIASLVWLVLQAILALRRALREDDDDAPWH